MLLLLMLLWQLPQHDLLSQAALSRVADD